jgi:hypothetical protein
MTSYETTTDIAAPAEQVWSILTDAAAYPSWNSTIISMEGAIADGQTISLVTTLNPKRTFRLTVSGIEAPSSMVWSDGMPLGLFSGVRTFSVAPTDDGGSTFSMIERYSGLLAPLITKSIPDMSDSFDAFAADLKVAAESAV